MKTYKFQVSRYIREYVVVEVDANSALNAGLELRDKTKEDSFLSDLIVNETWLFDKEYDPFEQCEIVLIDEDGNILSKDSE